MQPDYPQHELTRTMTRDEMFAMFSVDLDMDERNELREFLAELYNVHGAFIILPVMYDSASAYFQFSAAFIRGMN